MEMKKGLLIFGAAILVLASCKKDDDADTEAAVFSSVLINGESRFDFTQVGNKLTIPCNAETERIEIVGSWAIPEFGTIAVMILVVAIVSIIIVSAKTKLSLVPRY